MQAHPLEAYLADCRRARSTGAATPETAYYAALKGLLDAAGHGPGMDTPVHCVMGLRDQGAGMPDGGLFTPDQFVKGKDFSKPKPGQVAGPSGGVVGGKLSSGTC